MTRRGQSSGSLFFRGSRFAPLSCTFGKSAPLLNTQRHFPPLHIWSIHKTISNCKQKFSRFSGLSRAFLPKFSTAFSAKSNARFIVKSTKKSAPQYLVARRSCIAKYIFREPDKKSFVNSNEFYLSSLSVFSKDLFNSSRRRCICSAEAARKRTRVCFTSSSAICTASSVRRSTSSE